MDQTNPRKISKKLQFIFHFYSFALKFPMLFCFLALFLLQIVKIGAENPYYGGIPVPGRRVPAIRMFELFINTCRSSLTLEKLSKLIRSVNANKIAEKLQRNLYFAVDDVNIDTLMGKWYTMINTPLVHTNQCEISFYKLLDQSAYSATFSTVQYSVRASDASIKLSHGTGRKYGPDPGSLLIGTGEEAEPCSYFPVKIGPINKANAVYQYSYVVLTQAIKQPTIVLARDPEEFISKHRDEVMDYLRRFGYWRNAMTGTEMKSVDWQKCADNRLFYEHLEGEQNEEEKIE